MRKFIIILLLFTSIISAGFISIKNTKNDFILGVKFKNLEEIKSCKQNLNNFNALMLFEAWSNERTLDEMIIKLNNQQIKNLVVTWEPWKPTDFFTTVSKQSKPQVKYSNKKIADGEFDSYIIKFFESLKNFNGVVFIRYAHEPNGGNYLKNKYYYPWSYNNFQYKRSFKRIVRLSKSLNTKNIKFVYSIDPNWNESDKFFENSFKNFYPGDEIIDFIGITTINLGGRKVSNLNKKLIWVNKFTKKKIILIEWSSAFNDREIWIRDTIQYLDVNKNIIGLISSQGLSKAAFQQKIDQSQLTWSICTDEKSLELLNSTKTTGS